MDVFTEEPGKSALTVLRPPEEKSNVVVAPGDYNYANLPSSATIVGRGAYVDLFYMRGNSGKYNTSRFSGPGCVNDHVFMSAGGGDHGDGIDILAGQ